MTLNEKYDANIEFVKQLQKYCSQHRCISSNIPFAFPKCTLSQCESKITKSEIDYDNFLKIMEYEPPVDWSKVAVDAKIWVRSCEQHSWTKRHFAKYRNGEVYAFPIGKTFFTTDTTEKLTKWEFAKLAEVEDDK